MTYRIFNKTRLCFQGKPHAPSSIRSSDTNIVRSNCKRHNKSIYSNNEKK